MPSEPEFSTDASGECDFTFTQAFMVKLNFIISKYQIIMQRTIENQQQYRREAAIEAKDDTAYARAFFDFDRRLPLVTTMVHDIVLDYFLISPLQIEISGNKHDEDINFKIKLL